jgi:transcriptional regulator with XRE-family HTH domain
MWEQQIGERISQLRKERKLTRLEFGEMIGKSGQYVGRIERGSHTVSAAVIKKISDETGVSADYLIHGTADPVYTVASFNGLSRAQAQVTLDIAMNVINFLRTPNGNNTLLQEALRQHYAVAGAD